VRRPSPRPLAALTAAALLLFGCADDEPTIAVDDTSEAAGSDGATEEGGDDEVAEDDEAVEDDEAPVDDAPPAEEEPVPDDTADPEEGDADDAEDVEDAPDGTPTAEDPSPDASLLEEPCAPHDGREMEAFIAVVSPVADQQLGAGTDVALVGCSNVFEANVEWELQDATGLVIADGATTAVCGSGCVGAFDDTVDLSVGSGIEGLELHVFSRDASDGEGTSEDLRQIVPVAVD
jgi:hypothetical protein